MTDHTGKIYIAYVIQTGVRVRFKDRCSNDIDIF
jgi:hypothetical protein